MPADIQQMQFIILSIIVGTLMAIVYSLRVLVMMDRKIARMELNLLKIAQVVAEEEVRVEKEQEHIEQEIRKGGRAAKGRGKK
ncbi:hypothetical protein COT48_00205 [Candidatus Woesearchaeota archaeon CG08_land_8_20_14_0_20_47_9]|nr:MAG: hypothetical protein AUJ69_03030 [Candidatus Woesearchaeota archaeon CG1_02_47_18]PIN72937.1 MAG: hypothetical protein COV22_01875 [Candidatus Woesearchaeota archaeon CG10_big_fil_rev_8_21_14_0_10_47_5]PIO04488.1 MAG: hypothetical protein COT48_00205 [Candidatus Woesearchaeota archaeon CG08_land_8_20_14_0_20_47_9]HII30265.1 hypothetical protein [Candidatus Woesearchaeota archaeon]